MKIYEIELLNSSWFFNKYLLNVFSMPSIMPKPSTGSALKMKKTDMTPAFKLFIVF